MTQTTPVREPAVAHAPTPPHGDIHLPRRRHASPWSNRALLIIAVIIALMLAPFWLDPTLFAQLLGTPTGVSHTAVPSPVSLHATHFDYVLRGNIL